MATNSKAEKTGQACGRNILGFLSAGYFSIEKAKRNGNITEVATVDKDINKVLGVYASLCTIVTGS